MTQQIDVIVPVFNEQDGLPAFYQRISALPLPLRLIFIDNASTDRSVEIIRSFGAATLIEHPRNEGYGASLIDGMRAATADKVVIIDADCEYPPECLPELVAALDRHELVYASRFLGKTNAQQANMPYLKMLGNRAISGLFNTLFDQHTTDLYTGCKAFRRPIVADLDFQYSGFEHVLEFAARLAARGHRIHDVAVDFAPRRTGSSKMRHVSETVKYLYLITVLYVRARSGRL